MRQSDALNVGSSMSFGLLPEAEKQEVRDFFKSVSALNTKAQQTTAISKMTMPARVAPASSLMLTFYRQSVLKTDPVLLPYMDEAALLALQEDLLLAYYQLCDHYRLHSHENRLHKLGESYALIKQCEALLGKIQRVLDKTALSDDATQKKPHHFGHFLFEEELALQPGRLSVYLRKRMGDFNYWRLYWVWTGMLMRTALGLFNNAYHNISQTKYMATEYQNIWGYISWQLYYARFVINFGLVLKHTIPSLLWMSKEEMRGVKALGVGKRFLEQLELRKFELINDSIWGFVNMVCHLWWTGAGIRGYFGNVATVMLLMADASLAILRHHEDSQAHQKNTKEVANAIEALQKKIAALSNDSPQRKVLEHQKVRLELVALHLEVDWSYKRRSLNLDRFYSKSLVVSFFVLAGALVPDWMISASLATAMGLAGASMLFSCAIAYSAFRGYMEVSKARNCERRLLQEYDKRLGQLSVGNLSLQEMQSLELQAKGYKIESDYQHQMVLHQQKKLLRTLLVEGMTPVVMFCAFTFLSFGAGFTIFGLGVAAAILSSLLLEYNKPNEPEPAKATAPLQGFFSAIEKERVQARIKATEPKNKLSRLFFHSEAELGESKAAFQPALAG